MHHPLASSANDTPYGDSPFGVRGIAYVLALKHAKPAWIEPLRAKAGLRDFFSQIFLATAMYDARPLIVLFSAIARAEARDVKDVIVDRAGATAELDVKGMYRHLLKTTSAPEMAARLPKAFNRYFEPCVADVSEVTDTRMTATLMRLPEAFFGLHVYTTVGFVTRCLELAGAKRVQLRFAPPQPSPLAQSPATVDVGLTATWESD